MFHLKHVWHLWWCAITAPQTKQHVLLNLLILFEVIRATVHWHQSYGLLWAQACVSQWNYTERFSQDNWSQHTERSSGSSSPPANVDCVIYEVSDSSQRLLDSIVSPDHDAGRVHHNYTQLINSCHLHTCSFQTTSQAEGWWHWLSRIIRNVKKKNLNVSRALMWPLAAPYIEDKCRRWHRFRVSALN